MLCEDLSFNRTPIIFSLILHLLLLLVAKNSGVQRRASAGSLLRHSLYDLCSCWEWSHMHQLIRRKLLPAYLDIIYPALGCLNETGNLCAYHGSFQASSLQAGLSCPLQRWKLSETQAIMHTQHCSCGPQSYREEFKILIHLRSCSVSFFVLFWAPNLQKENLPEGPCVFLAQLPYAPLWATHFDCKRKVS